MKKIKWISGVFMAIMVAACGGRDPEKELAQFERTLKDRAKREREAAEKFPCFSDQESKNFSLFAAVRKTDPAEVERLLACGADPNAQTQIITVFSGTSLERRGGLSTPLMFLFMSGCQKEGSGGRPLAVFRKLLQGGADLRKRDYSGDDVFAHAYSCDQRELLQELFFHDREWKRKFPFTAKTFYPFMVTKNASFLELLLENENEETIKAKMDEFTLLYYAVKSNSLVAAEKLLKWGLSPQSSSQVGLDGRGPLHVAAQEGFLDMVRLLLNFGASPWDRTFGEDGKTPLDVAKNEAVRDILRKAMTGGFSE